MLIIILLAFIFCFILERIFPGWNLPKVHSWTKRVLIINFLQLFVVLLAGVTWERWFSHFSLIELSKNVSPLVGGLIAYFIATFVFYWWHRARHESDFLWRMFHQIHHSPQRLEVITSFYKHPQEMIVNSIIGSLLVYSFLGLDIWAGGYYTLFTALGEFFYHTNVKTPRWIGYFFQRPEMHRIHHEYGKHKNNYGDIVWWDMLFGTYDNPKEWHGSCGFDIEKELRLPSMLKFKDVHKASKGLLGKTKVVTLLCVFSLLISSNESDACSVFAHKLKDNSLVVAKNFDWISGDGYLVVNARQMQRRSFREPELFKWVSKYGSISFTTVGPGLPVSSMNEKGLVVEALVDKDFSGDFSHVNSLLSLEWAQYVLDNFESTDSVIEFSKKHAFDQVVVALHFFVCDRLGHCAVIESNDSDQSKLDIISDDDLLFKVLANGDWHKDYNKSQSLQGMLSAYISKLKFMPSFSSYKRFGTLVSTLKVGKQLSLSDVFDSLDQAKIVSLIRWQIAWKPNEKVGHWRRYNGYGAGKIQRYSTAELSYACDKKIQVMDLHDFSTNHLRDYKMSDINKVEERLRKVMYWRLGGVEKSLAANLARFTMSSKCVR